MSIYGSPGRPHPGQPQDPYEQPSDPWGTHDRQDGEPVDHDQPGYGQQGYGPGQGGYGEVYQAGPGMYGTTYRHGEVGQDLDPAPPGRSSTRLIVAIVAVLAVLLAGGVAAALYLTGDDDKPAASPSAPPGSAGAAQAGGQPGTPTGTPAPESSTEARFAVAGQCLANDGTEAKPAMRIVACAPNTYQVLARFDGTTDYTGKCGKVKGYQFHFYFDAELDTLDYVLCLKRRQR